MISATPLTQKGFTLIELVIVLVLLGVLGAYVYSDNASPELSVPSQAETLAGHLRHLQNEAISRGNPMGITVASGSYIYGQCTNANCTAKTNTTPVTLNQNVTLTVVSGSATVYFDTLGQASSTTVFSLSHDGYAYRVLVDALTGHVAVAGA